MTGLWERVELGKSVGVRSRPGLENHGLSPGAVRSLGRGLSWEVASSYLYVEIAVGRDKWGGL